MKAPQETLSRWGAGPGVSGLVVRLLLHFVLLPSDGIDLEDDIQPDQEDDPQHPNGPPLVDVWGSPCAQHLPQHEGGEDDTDDSEHLQDDIFEHRFSYATQPLAALYLPVY